MSAPAMQLDQRIPQRIAEEPDGGCEQNKYDKDDEDATSGTRHAASLPLAR